MHFILSYLSFFTNLRLVVTFYITRLGYLPVCLSLVCSFFCMFFLCWLVVLAVLVVCFFGLFQSPHLRYLTLPPFVCSGTSNLILQAFRLFCGTWFCYFSLHEGRQMADRGLALALVLGDGGFFGHCVVCFSLEYSHCPTATFRSHLFLMSTWSGQSYNPRQRGVFFFFFRLLLLCCSPLS